jgi:hypothetical protein
VSYSELLSFTGLSLRLDECYGSGCRDSGFVQVAFSSIIGAYSGSERYLWTISSFFGHVPDLEVRHAVLGENKK